MIIYILQNKVNGKVYVGQTSGTLEKRWNQHKASARNGNGWRIYRAIRKYGPDSFNVSVLATCETLEEADCLEKRYIASFNSQDPVYGYNIMEGGSGGSCNEEARARKSAKLKGRVFSEKTRKQMSKSASRVRSQQWTEERRKKHSERMMGAANPFFGKKHTKEVQEKILAGLLKARKEARLDGII
jgi:group I intron endonuclease